MDKNDHLHSLMGGYSERIGDWTPQQLADFIQGLSNDPTAMPHAFQTKQLHVTENLVIGGKQFQHAVFPRGLTMGDPKGIGTSVQAKMHGSNAMNRAYAALNSSAKHIFAESFDMRDADRTGGVSLSSGTQRLQAIYVPTKERLTHMQINYATFEVGGTFTYGGYALYGPVAWDHTIPGFNLTAVPQVAITETNLASNFRATGPHFVSGGLHAYTNSWDIVLQPGIYFVVVLYVWSVAPGTDAALVRDASAALPGSANASLAVPHFVDSGIRAGTATLPTNLNVTAFTNSDTRIWVSLYDDRTKQI